MSILRAFFGRLVTGFFILLPVIIVYLMLGQLVDMLVVLTVPIVDVLPRSLFSSEWDHRLTAGIVLILTCLVAGLVAETRLAIRFGSWFERTFLDRFPPYSILKSLSQRMGGDDEANSLQPALLTVADDTRMLVAIVEELPDGHLSVFVPLAPTPGLGVLQIVSAGKVERLECSMSDAVGWVLNWGAGTDALMRPPSTSGADADG